MKNEYFRNILVSSVLNQGDMRRIQTEMDRIRGLQGEIRTV